MGFELIKIFRECSGLTQNDLSSELGVNRATISKYENGIIEIPVSQAKKICKILRIKNWYDLYE